MCFKLISGISVAVLASYRSPEDCTRSSFLEELVVGDLNYNMLDSDCPLEEFCKAHGFSNTIQSGTRLNPITFVLTLLDVILTLCFGFFLKSKVFPFSLSDHSLILSVFDYSSRKCKPKNIITRCI